LRALALYEQPADSRSNELESSSYWATAAQDFRVHLEQPGAPARWAAAYELSLAKEALLQGNLDVADRRLRDATHKDPAWAAPHIALSAVLAKLALAYHARRGMDAEAREWATRALQDDPDLVAAHLLLAESYLEQRELTPALEHASRAAARSPRDSAALLIKGDVLLAMGREDETRDELERAVEVWESTRQLHAPEERLNQVKDALAKGRLPAPRVGMAAAASARPRSAPAPRAGPAPRSRPLPPRTVSCPPGDPLCSVY